MRISNISPRPSMQVRYPIVGLDQLDSDPVRRIRYCEGDIYQISRWLKTRRQGTTILTAFVLAMTLNPHVYKKAQKVIDEQIGRDRLIEPSDRENLPYITCLLKEVIRYVHPVTDERRIDPFSG